MSHNFNIPDDVAYQVRRALEQRAAMFEQRVAEVLKNADVVYDIGDNVPTDDRSTQLALVRHATNRWSAYAASLRGLAYYLPDK